MNESFTDYVMYQPPDGIWVPEGTYSWSGNAKASYSSGSLFSGAGWSLTMVVPPKVTPNPISPNHNTWPTWNDVTYNWNTFR